jgi:hypothetical protein
MEGKLGENHSARHGCNLARPEGLREAVQEAEAAQAERLVGGSQTDALERGRPERAAEG